jgi:hypothetical protein
VPSIRNDAAFLAAVVGSTSVLAVIAGAVLPGDWGFFSSYLIGEKGIQMPSACCQRHLNKCT